jgi:hypothetical protein
MIFHEYKTIFVHIPKTGGTSVENMLWPDRTTRTEKELWMGFVKPLFNKYQTGGLQHLLARQISCEVGREVFENYYKFAFVRNPWDKAVSQYVFMNRRQDLREFIGMSSDHCFEKYLELIKKREHVQWKKQTDFVLDTHGELMVDDVVKLEEVTRHAERLSAQVGVSFNNLPHDNKGIRKDYYHYYDATTREMVADMYKEDIEYFAYAY